MDTNIASRILDQTKAVVSDAAVAGFLFFVVLPHKVGDSSWGKLDLFFKVIVKIL
jgi:hypothetical protein